MATSKVTTASPVKVLSFDSQPARFQQVVDAIARTNRVLVLCGELASEECRLPKLEDRVEIKIGAESRWTPLRTLLKECSPSHVAPDTLDPRALANLNRAMTVRRIAARNALPSSFHDLLSRLCREGKLIACLTTAIDGLEAYKDPAVEERTVMLHGDNRTLRCCRRDCSGTDQVYTRSLDTTLLAADSLADDGSSSDRMRYCDACFKKYTKTSLQKRNHKKGTLLLRPAVQMELGGDMMAGAAKAQMLAYAHKSQLLLIVEEALKTRELLDLSRELAEAVHEKSGAVVYVGRELLRGNNLFNHIDLHLDLDTVQLVNWVNQADMTRSTKVVDRVEDYNDHDFWFDVVRNEMQPLVQGEEKLHDGQHCDSRFCCRRIGFDESVGANIRLNDKGVPIPTDEPTAEGQTTDEVVDPYPLEEACLILHHYSERGSRPSIEDAKKAFVCFDCWRRDLHGLYPHYVRPVPRYRPEELGQLWPRLAMVIYYVEQFWPQATHLMNLVGSKWANKGWACKIEPVKIEHLSETRALFVDTTWEPGTYSVYVVYLTHGLSGEQGYQTGHGQALQPAEFLEWTLPPAETIMRNARETRGFICCCGHPFLHSGLVAKLAAWLNSGPFETVVGALNPRLSPAYMLTFIANLSIHMADQEPQPQETIFRCWLTDAAAASHTNILYMARGCNPSIWQYAPFQSRPLGKALPSIMSTCTCPGLPEGQFRVVARHGSRKTWEVDHNGKNGVPLRDVVLKATCTVCRQTWPLPSEHLAGVLRKHSGMFAAVVPYFV